MIQILQNFERVLWDHILVNNILNFKSINAELKKLWWDQLRKVDNYTRKKWKFWHQKMISNFLFRSSFVWLQENCNTMISKKLNNHRVFNKYICLLMSIQKQFWLSRLLLRQRLPNGGETVSLLCGFGGDPLHTHPKRHKFSSWNTSRGKEWIEKHWRSFPARSALLLRHAEFIWGVFKRV